jgi:hypothetical protein
MNNIFTKFILAFICSFLAYQSAMASGLASKLASENSVTSTTDQNNPYYGNQQENLNKEPESLNSSRITFQIPQVVENAVLVPYSVSFPAIKQGDLIEVYTGNQFIPRFKPKAATTIYYISSRFKAQSDSIHVKIYRNGVLSEASKSPKMLIKSTALNLRNGNNQGGFEFHERQSANEYKTLMKYTNFKNDYLKEITFNTDKGSIVFEGSYLVGDNPFIAFKGDLGVVKFNSAYSSNGQLVN